LGISSTSHTESDDHHFLHPSGRRSYKTTFEILSARSWQLR
jgi:hypothetical protein